MSTFPDTVSDGRRSGKAPEKSNFSQTCSLLSQFLKEKRSSGASTHGIGGKMEHRASRKDLLANQQNSDGALKLNASAMDFLPQLVENPCIKKSNVRSPGQEESPQLTIFYAGKMLVFDAFLPEKATEVMELATKLASDNSSTAESPPNVTISTEKLNSSKVPQTNTTSETPKPGNQVGSDMRYPRRASLLKFLEKRKERVIARGPYQINNNNPKREGSSSGGEPEDQCSEHFDLNL
ncbi:jasmonate ZIM domain-containing protein 1-like [Gastrolobium bilobum]|uniref:jasmonate ZIM domain-containing protein 1-like n=1 Tax=Gastrolobium bilobum TaxID=150636 RepID=UPI002AB04241|nr:jasmonate ZIM domain-containing protein 1-like [Gastrolobium bilobum]